MSNICGNLLVRVSPLLQSQLRTSVCPSIRWVYNFSCCFSHTCGFNTQIYMLHKPRYLLIQVVNLLACNTKCLFKFSALEVTMPLHSRHIFLSGPTTVCDILCLLKVIVKFWYDLNLIPRPPYNWRGNNHSCVHFLYFYVRSITFI